MITDLDLISLELIVKTGTKGFELLNCTLKCEKVKFNYKHLFVFIGLFSPYLKNGKNTEIYRFSGYNNTKCSGNSASSGLLLLSLRT